MSSAHTAHASLATTLRWLGRADLSRPHAPVFAWSGSGFEARFTGRGLRARLDNDDGFMFLVTLDGQRVRSFLAEPGQHVYTLASGLTPGLHRIALLRQSEAQAGDTRLLALTVEDGALEPPADAPERLLEVVGDSISCGYGNLGPDPSCPFSFATESHWDTYAAVAARRLGAELSTVAVSGAGLVRNFDGSRTSTLPALYDRVTFREPARFHPPRAPDAVIIHLGTNDFAHGDPGAAFEAGYRVFLARLRRDYPRALLILAHGPMLFDNPARGEWRLTRIRERLAAVLAAQKARGDTRLALLEFPASKDPELGCGAHPNAKKHALMGARLAELLRERLGW